MASLLAFAVGAAALIAGVAMPVWVLLLVASVLLCGAAAVASISVMLRRHYRNVRSAFDFGRDTGRREALPLQRVP